MIVQQRAQRRVCEPCRYLEKTNLPFELQGRDGCCSRVIVGQNRPHLGLCLGHNVPLQGRQGSRGCIPDSSEVRPRLKGKQSTLLSSQVATGISWSPLSGLKGVKPPVKFGERTRDCSPGQAGKEVPNLAMTVGFPELRRQCGVSHEV